MELQKTVRFYRYGILEGSREHNSLLQDMGALDFKHLFIDWCGLKLLHRCQLYSVGWRGL